VIVAGHRRPASPDQEIEVRAAVGLEHVLDVETGVAPLRGRLRRPPGGAPARQLLVRDGEVQPPAGDVELAVARWRATLTDGTEVDSSAASPEGAPVRVSAALAGVREALKLMPAGARWQVFVPPHLGHGDRGRGREIPPNAVLVYDLELVRAP